MIEMIHKNIAAIGPDDIQTLIDNQVPEDRRLDYKRDLPPPGENLGFLKHVAAFANADGGDIIFGVTEKTDDAGKKTRLPDEVVGLEGFNSNTAISQLQSAAIDGIVPRIPALAFQPVQCPGGRNVLVVRIPQSWTGPHMVVCKDDNHFYLRDSGGKHPMDWQELRDAFILSGAVVERIRAWRDKRLDAIESDQTIIRTREVMMAVLHTAPMSAFSTSLSTDVTESVAQVLDVSPQWRPDGCGYLRYCLDGYVCSTVELGSEPYWFPSYALYFRHGGVEEVVFSLPTTSPFETEVSSAQPRPLVYPWSFAEPRIVAALEQELSVLRACGIQGPYVVMLSFCFASGLQIQNGFGFREGFALKPNRVTCPEVMLGDEVENETQSIARAMRPAFNYLWNGFGKRRSPNYDDAGEWKPVQT